MNCDHQGPKDACAACYEEALKKTRGDGKKKDAEYRASFDKIRLLERKIKILESLSGATNADGILEEHKAKESDPSLKGEKVLVFYEPLRDRLHSILRDQQRLTEQVKKLEHANAKMRSAGRVEITEVIDEKIVLEEKLEEKTRALERITEELKKDRAQFKVDYEKLEKDRLLAAAENLAYRTVVERVREKGYFPILTSVLEDGLKFSDSNPVAKVMVMEEVSKVAEKEVDGGRASLALSQAIFKYKEVMKYEPKRKEWPEQK